MKAKVYMCRKNINGKQIIRELENCHFAFDEFGNSTIIEVRENNIFSYYYARPKNSNDMFNSTDFFKVEIIN